MTRPFLAVTALLVLWLIVAVPMVLRVHDDRAHDRTVRRFGKGMRALNRASGPRLAGAAFATASYVTPRITVARDELFVATRSRNEAKLAGRRRDFDAQEAHMSSDLKTEAGESTRAAGRESSARTPRRDTSAGHARMMARRRRSLTILGGGTLVSLLLALVVNGGLFWTLAALFLTGLAGYVYFLRSQALRDRERREHRVERAAGRRPRAHDVTAQSPFFAEPDPTVVRIDDDDVTLHNLDTVDLTGLYNSADHERDQDFAVAQRRAS